MDERDPWLAPDKFEHVLLGFSLTIIFSAIVNRTGYLFLRSYSITIGSIASLFAGAAKEVADELGFFNSAGASAKDAVADLIGVLIAALILSVFKSLNRSDSKASQTREVSLV